MTDQTISHSRVLEKLGGGQPAEAGDAFHFVPYFLVRLVPRWPPGPFPRHGPDRRGVDQGFPMMGKAISPYRLVERLGGGARGR